MKIAHGTSSEFKVIGTNFASNATVTISGGFAVNSVTFVNSTELKVKVTAGNGSERGTYNVTENNPTDGGSVTSSFSIENT